MVSFSSLGFSTMLCSNLSYLEVNVITIIRFNLSSFMQLNITRILLKSDIYKVEGSFAHFNIKYCYLSKVCDFNHDGPFRFHLNHGIPIQLVRIRISFPFPSKRSLISCLTAYTSSIQQILFILMLKVIAAALAAYAVN